MQPAANRRLLRGIIAFLGSAAMRVAVQVTTLPILFASWSPERVGGWLLLFALPAYFAVVGQAFSGAGGNIALAAAQKEEWVKARSAMRASWLVSTGLTILLIAVTLLPAAAFAAPIAAAIGVLEPGEFMTAVAWLGLYVVGVGQSAAVGIAFRIGGRYPQFVMSNSAVTLAEVAVLAICVLLSGSYVPLAASLAILRLVFAAGQLAYARRAVPALFAAHAESPRVHVRTIIRPSAAFLLLPIVYVLNLQGYTVLVGAAFGAGVLATFVATRTLVRLVDLATNVVFGIQFAEAGYLGANKAQLQRRQLATMTLVALAIAAGFSVFLLVAGPWLQAAFTLGKTSFDRELAAVLLASGTIRALAVTPQAIVSAENRHSTFVASYLAGSIACLAIAYALTLNGASLPLVLALLIPAELAQAIPAFRSALVLVQTRPQAFMRSLFSRERWTDVTDLWRFLRRGTEGD